MKVLGGFASLAIAVVALILVATSAFVVQETEQVVLTQFGRPVGRPITTPGLHWKTPLIQSVHLFDKRFLEWEGNPNQVATRDKRFIWVDTYARWRITDPLLFFQRLRDERGAQSRLDDILDGEVRNAIANHDLEEVVRSTSRRPAMMEESEEEGDDVLTRQIESGREKITREILAASAGRVEDLGMEVLDVRFKRINYVEEVRAKVYERMISERKRIADRYRSEGSGEALRIRGEREMELLRIRSEAYKNAQAVVGRADAKATEIYAAAYDRTPDARDFFGFLKTMETYRATTDSSTSMILSTDGELTRYLKGSGGR